MVMAKVKTSRIASKYNKDVVLALLWFAFAPADITAALDARYPGWQPAPIAIQIQQWFREYGFRYEPNSIRTDLDGDGAEDYALLVTKGGRELLIAAMARKGKWEIIELANDNPDPFTYLLLNEKGSRDFDFRTLKHYRHARNSVALIYFDRTPYVYAWRKGAFTKNPQLNDEE
jgi:hypothetical protein